MNVAAETINKPNTALRVSLWIAQFLVGVPFVAFGFMKLTMPISELSKIMIWAGEFPVLFVRSIGLIDIAGGLGIVLPALTRVKPNLTVWAALGCVCLQICAIVFHTSRGEAALTPLNYILLALAIFVYWGRRNKAPITSRT